MNKCIHLLDHKSLLNLYGSFISPYMDYCSEIWGNTYNSHLVTVFRLQKNGIRIVCKVGQNEYTNLLFLNSNILKFEDLLKLKSLIMYKARKKQLPGDIQKLFTETEGGYNLRGMLNFKVQHVRTTLKSQCITRRGVNLWND